MIQNLKELQALLKLCRKQGVTEIDLCGTKIKFGDLPKKNAETDEVEEPDADSDLTPEQLMFFSVGGAPPP